MAFFQNVAPTFDWLDAARIVITILLSVALASSWLDAYRVKIMRREHEEVTGEVHDALENARSIMSSVRNSEQKFSKDYDDLSQRLDNQLDKVGDLLSAALLIVEYLYERAVKKEPLTDDELSAYRKIIDEFKAMGIN